MYLPIDWILSANVLFFRSPARFGLRQRSKNFKFRLGVVHPLTVQSVFGLPASPLCEGLNVIRQLSEHVTLITQLIDGGTHHAKKNTTPDLSRQYVVRVNSCKIRLHNPFNAFVNVLISAPRLFRFRCTW